MSKRIAERQRWVKLFAFEINAMNNGSWNETAFRHALHIVEAFAKIGRVVRVEAEDELLVLRARR